MHVLSRLDTLLKLFLAFLEAPFDLCAAVVRGFKLAFEVSDFPFEFCFYFGYLFLFDLRGFEVLLSR